MSAKRKLYSDITPELRKLAETARDSMMIDSSLYSKWDVKRGLRDLNGKGVLAGLTHISDVQAVKIVDGVSQPTDGNLYYRGYSIKDLVRGFTAEERFGFDEVAYLLHFDKLPDAEELKAFSGILSSYRFLPKNFVRDVIMKSPTNDMMNALSRSVLMLYSYDRNPDDISIPNVLRQGLQLISMMPLIAVYSYQAYIYYNQNDSLFIHKPDQSLSPAENLLHLLRPDSRYTPLEARLLDLALVLHMDHGGGNNSTFTTHVVTSTGTDTYSVIAASLGSLKGPKHGGANVKVVQMFDDLKNHVSDWKDEDAITDYLGKLLEQQAFDRQGLIYGMGHAVYSLSDPRQVILKGFAEMLAKEKGMENEFELYAAVERLGPKVIAEKRHIYKGVCCNVDFYSGFVYSMLNLPLELYTPLFAIARIAGWSAHRLEELSNGGKIIRPAFKSAQPQRDYTSMEER